MKLNFTHIAIFSLAASVMQSCGQNDMPGIDGIGDDTAISFHTSLPAVNSRASGTSLSLADGFDVTAFCPEDENAVTAGTLAEYFKVQKVSLDVDNRFRSEQCKWPANRGTKQGYLKFFAFFPEINDLYASVGADNTSGLFASANYTTITDGTPNYDYRLERFKVAEDIYRQVDFLTADTEGTKADNLYKGIDLSFSHRMCHVQIKAWGANPSYNFEVAGVRIGGTVTECDFSLSDPDGAATTPGRWMLEGTTSKGAVEYIFREADGDGSPDAVVVIDDTNHNTKATAASIMGNARWAMMIPCTNESWNHTADAENAAQGMYISVLVRVTDKNGINIYPYPEATAEDDSSSKKGIDAEIIYLLTDKTGNVKARLYKDGDTYFTTADFADGTACTVDGDTEMVREYGWASLPVNVAWKQGTEYTYILDYTKGVGVHDPESPKAGLPILNSISIGIWSETSDPWADPSAGIEIDEFNQEGLTPFIYFDE